MYISGLPGTGKSFTVQRALQTLAAEHTPSPVSITINCMALADTKDVYAVLLAECARALATGETRGEGAARVQRCYTRKSRAGKQLMQQDKK